MLKILREHEVAIRFRKELKKSGEAYVAVPYWGRGAAKILGLQKNSKVRVICNLFQPGCQPEAIEELRGLGIKVRSHPRLHAKIYVTPNIAIVGSSNVSSNGLTEQGRDALGWIEANAVSNEREFVETAIGLFEGIWTDPDTFPVRKSDIEAARELQRHWPLSELKNYKRSKTLIAACRNNPDEFQSVFVAAYGEPLGKNAKRLLKQVHDGALPPKSNLTVSDFRKAWGYQIDGIPENAWLVDLNCTRSPARCGGTAHASALKLKVDDEPDLTLAIPRRIQIRESHPPLFISATEKAQLASIASQLQRKGLVPLAHAVKMIDRAH